MNGPLDPTRLRTYIADLCDGAIAPADFVQLETMLADHRDARATFLRYCDLHVQLHWIVGLERDGLAEPLDSPPALRNAADFNETAPSPAAAPLPDGRSPRAEKRRWLADIRSPRAYSLAAAAIILLVGLAILALVRAPWDRGWRGDPAPQIAGPAETPAYLARVADMHGCRWSEGTAPIRLGAELASHRHIGLERGVVELAFGNGAKVVLEGPVEFEILSQKKGRLELGKLHASVPRRGIGFEIETPRETIVDLGTEFGVRVEPERGTEVVVFAGEVAVEPKRPVRRHRIQRGEAVWFDVAGVPTAREGTELAASFVRSAGEYRSALLSEYIMRNDPLVYFSMHRAGDSLLREEVSGEPAGLLNWRDDDASWPAGRFGESLQFLGLPANRSVRVPREATKLPVDFSRGAETALPFSVALWVKGPREQIDGCCLVSKGPGLREQFSLDVYGNRFRFFVRDAQREAREVWVPHGPNQTWQHVVAVYDPRGPQISLWINGKPQTTDLPAEFASLFSAADDLTIGARVGERPDDWLAFNGQIDELAIFPHALTAEQILRLYKYGRD